MWNFIKTRLARVPLQEYMSGMHSLMNGRRGVRTDAAGVLLIVRARKRWAQERNGR